MTSPIFTSGGYTVADYSQKPKFATFDFNTWTAYDIKYNSRGPALNVFVAQDNHKRMYSKSTIEDTIELNHTETAVRTRDITKAFLRGRLQPSYNNVGGEYLTTLTGTGNYTPTPRRMYIDGNEYVLPSSQTSGQIYLKSTIKITLDDIWRPDDEGHKHGSWDLYNNLYHLPFYYEVTYSAVPKYVDSDGNVRLPIYNIPNSKYVIHPISGDTEYGEDECVVYGNVNNWKITPVCTGRTDTTLTVKAEVLNSTVSHYFTLLSSNGTVLAKSSTFADRANTYTFTGLTPNTTYKIKAYLRGSNDYMIVPSQPITVTTPQTISNVTVSNITSTGARITWGPLSANESISIFSSRNLMQTNITTSYTNIFQPPGSIVTYTIHKLSKIGSPAVCTITVTALLEPPVVNLINISGGITITYGANGATSYNIYNNNTLLTNTSSTTYTNNTIGAGTQLSLTVEAVAPGVLSAKSQPLEVTVGLDAPVLTIATRVNAVATMSWAPVPGATSYVIGTVNPVDGTYIDGSTTNTNSFTHQGAADTKFYVRAKYGSAVSGPSNVIVYTQSSPPTNLQGTYSANGTSLTLTWNPAIGAGYTYYVYRATGAQTGYQYEDVSSTSATTITIPATVGTSVAQTYLVSSLPIQFQIQPVYGIVNYMPTVIGSLGMAPYNTPAATVTVYPKLSQVTVTDISASESLYLAWQPVVCDGTTEGVTYRIRRLYNEKYLSDIITTSTNYTIIPDTILTAPVVYSVIAEKNGCTSFGQQTHTVSVTPRLTFSSSSTTGATVCVPYDKTQQVIRFIRNGLVNQFDPYYFSDTTTSNTTKFRQILVKQTFPGTTITLGVQVSNTIFGQTVWSSPRNITFTIPSTPSTNIVSASAPNVASIQLTTQTPPASVSVLMLADDSYVPYMDTTYDSSTNSVNIPNLEQGSSAQVMLIALDENGNTVEMSAPITVTAPRTPNPPVLEVSGANILLNGGDSDISYNTFIRTDTGATILTKVGSVTSVSISEIASAFESPTDFTVSIQVKSANDTSSFLGISNIVSLPATPTNISPASWLNEQITKNTPVTDIKTTMRSNATAFSDDKVTLPSTLNIFDFIDTINTDLTKLSGILPRGTIVTPKPGWAANITDISTGIIYINAEPGQSVILEINGVTYTIQVTTTGFTYAGTNYALGDSVQFGSSYYIILGLGSVLLQPYTPSPPPSSVVPCFLGSARVLTSNGYVRIAALRAGDRIKTDDGRVVAISRVSVNEVAATGATNPFVIPRGLYGAVRDIRVSPDHKILVDGAMIEARRAPGLTREEHQGTLTYYNLELPDMEDRMVVDGVVCESLAHVRRMVMSMNDFMGAIRRKYGSNIGPHVLQRIKQTCRVLADGRVEVPVMSKK